MLDKPDELWDYIKQGSAKHKTFPPSHKGELQMRHLVLIVAIGLIGCDMDKAVEPRSAKQLAPKTSGTNATKPISAYWLTRYDLPTGIYDKENGMYSCASKTLTLASNNTIQYKVSGDQYGNTIELQIHLTVTSDGRSIQEVDYLIEILDALNIHLRNKETHFTIMHILGQTTTAVGTNDYQEVFNMAIKNYNDGKEFQLIIKITIVGDKQRN